MADIAAEVRDVLDNHPNLARITASIEALMKIEQKIRKGVEETQNDSLKHDRLLKEHWETINRLAGRVEHLEGRLAHWEAK